MGIKSFMYSLEIQHPYTHAQVLANWVEAAFKLHENYKSLTLCLSKNKLEKGKDIMQTLFIGQCPADQLVLLLVNIHNELEKLLLDMDTVDSPGPASHKKNYKKLAAHTIVLNRLNQQAQTRLLLTTFTSA